MTAQFLTTCNRVAAIAVFALLLATTACGATKSTALTPAAGSGAQQADASAALTGGFAGDSYLMADVEYGVRSRVGGATSPMSDAHVCVPSGSTCLEP
jgi:hypothetical protein